MEDFSAYMVPNPVNFFKTPDTLNETEADRLKRLYLKSAAVPEQDENLRELTKVLSDITDAYISSFQCNRVIPYSLRDGFERDMKNYSQSLPDNVASEYNSALDDGGSVLDAVGAASLRIEQGMRTLAGKLARYDQEFSTWLAMYNYLSEGYNRYLFISKQGPNTCELCLSYHGKVFTVSDDVPIPPLHPNCRCQLLIMDTMAEKLYYMNRRGFLEAFEHSRTGPEGGIFVLDHDFYRD